MLYLLQLLDGLRLAATPTDAERVDDLAIIVIVLFALGVARAWGRPNRSEDSMPS